MAKRNRKTKRGEKPEVPKAKRCQFTLLPEDVDLIEKLRGKYQKLAVPESEAYIEVTKSRIIRAGIRALEEMPDTKLKKTITSIEKLPEGRRKQD